MEERIADKVDQPSSSQSSYVATLDRATHVRYWVIFFAITLAMITYIDRVCISKAAPFISQELELTKSQMGLAFSAFTFAYAVFEIPGGWLGDLYGARRVLMRVVIWWSFFTAATGWVWNWPSLLVTRFLFGIGEAGCFPNITRAFTTWLPSNERVRAQGLLWLSARWGGAFTPLLVAFVLNFISWRRAFGVFGLIGVVWAFFFFRWYRDRPTDHKGINNAELSVIPSPESVIAAHGSVPWKKFLRSKTVWLLWIQYAFLSYPWYFYITWLPTYLQEGRRVTGTLAAVLAGFPLFFGGLGSLFCGHFSSYLERRTGQAKTVRRLLAGIGFLGAALFLVISINLGNPVWAMLAMGMASFSNDLAMPPSWGACMDVGGRYVGSLSGSMNMMGNLGGAIGSAVIGYILEGTNQNWDLALYICAAVYFLGIFCWMFIDPVTPLDDVKEDELTNAATEV